ncbi:hypothetical protein ABBQ38_004674 [Trebouxia sp. C0009 RCD-2024]
MSALTGASLYCSRSSLGKLHQENVRAHAKCSRRPTERLCASAHVTSVEPEPTLFSIGAEKLLSLPPVYALALKQARKKICDRGHQLGIDFQAEVAKLRQAADWDAELHAAQDPDLQLPAYFKAKFHAYSQGNLSWEAALEASVISQFVHASVMDPEGKIMSAKGDADLRSSYSAKLRTLMQQAGVKQDIKQIVDLGCSTGLSSLELNRAFPQAQITAVELSPYFLAVAKFAQRQRQDSSNAEPITFCHAAAEQTQLPDCSQDLVSACLVFHELPQSAAKEVMQEAHRILRPGGALAIMEMNPQSPYFQRRLSNPFAYAAFRSTEPFLLDYMSLDLGQLAKSAGFSHASEMDSTPSHKTFLACKK